MVNTLNDGLSKPDQLAEGKFIQAGSGIASNVAVAVSFDSAFDGVPKVQLTVAQSGAAATHPGTIVGTAAGSFTFLGTSGLAYNYLALYEG